MSDLVRVPELAVIDGKPTATTLQIAEAFDKRHDNVLRDIDELLAQVPESFGKPNFEVSEYTVTNNLGFAVPKPMYRLARDGFMLAVMGYTGRKAMAVKVAYIEAFNRMEARVADQHAQIARLRALVFELKPEYGVIVRCRKAGLTRVQTAGALGWGEKRVRLAARTLAAAGLLPARDSAQLSLLEG